MTFPIRAFRTPGAMPIVQPSTGRPKMVPASVPCPSRSASASWVKFLATISTPEKAAWFLSMPVSAGYDDPVPGERAPHTPDGLHPPTHPRCHARTCLRPLEQSNRPYRHGQHEVDDQPVPTEAPQLALCQIRDSKLRSSGAFDGTTTGVVYGSASPPFR